MLTCHVFSASSVFVVTVYMDKRAQAIYKSCSQLHESTNKTAESLSFSLTPSWNVVFLTILTIVSDLFLFGSKRGNYTEHCKLLQGEERRNEIV